MVWPRFWKRSTIQKIIDVNHIKVPGKETRGYVVVCMAQNWGVATQIVYLLFIHFCTLYNFPRLFFAKCQKGLS